MLTQSEADALLRMVKVLVEQRSIAIPKLGGQNRIRLKDDKSGKTEFIMDMQRKSLNVLKITYQTRHEGSVLIRVDTHGSNHPNPDGTEVPCPHIHIYREGYADSWAYPLKEHLITNTNDLARMLIDFLIYNNVKDVPEISYQGDELL